MSGGRWKRRAAAAVLLFQLCFCMTSLAAVLPVAGREAVGEERAFLTVSAVAGQGVGGAGSGEGAEGDGLEQAEQGLDQFDLKGIEDFLKKQQEQTGVRLSFMDLMKDLMAGRFTEVFRTIGAALKDSLFAQVHESGAMMGQIVVLGIIGAVFTNFSSVFPSSQISETGFFVTYLLLFTFLAAGFFNSIQIAGDVLENILDFMRALIPAYFLAVAFAGGSLSSLAVYEFTLFIIGVVQWLFFTLLLPLVRVYILFVLAGHIAKDNMLSKLTALIKQLIGWSLKTLVGVVVGFHLIQGMVLPYVDSVKNTSIRRLIEVIPGIGQGASAMTQMVLGSGVLIKNTMGAAALVILAVITIIPVLKLVVLMILYQCVAAVMQPVCDKRIVSCVEETAQGHRMLLNIVLSALLLFVITIALVCGASNTTYFSA